MTFAKATGDGYDLPYGCIFYRKGTQPGKFYIFWNPKGAAVSVDRRIQQVCYESETALTGNIFHGICRCVVFFHFHKHLI